MAGKFGFEKSTWNRYDLTDKNGNDITDRVTALENIVKGLLPGGTLFPIGTVLCFATDDITAKQLNELYGGTWRLFGQGRTLVGGVYDNKGGLGYNQYMTGMTRANTIFNPSRQNWCEGKETEDGTSPIDTPNVYQWSAKVGVEGMPLHTHFELGNGHWHYIYNNGSSSADHHIYQKSGSSTKANWVPSTASSPAQPSDDNALCTYGSKASSGLVNLSAEGNLNGYGEIPIWQPFITVWYYKRIA